MNRCWNPSRSTLCVVMVGVLSLVGLVVDASAQQGSLGAGRGNRPATKPQGEIRPPHVFAHVALVQGELELIRTEMGKPRNLQIQIGVTGAAPREVFFQALTLFRKADALCFEQTREKAPMPETPSGEIKPADVWRVVDAALQRLHRVKKKLAIPEQVRGPRRDDSRTPTDVFRAIVEADRQLNLLLDHQFSPAEVFQQVTTAVAYTSRLLERFPGATRIAETPPYERGKRPPDVFERLLECTRRVRAITERSGLEMLILVSDRTALQQATPSDVYDLVTLIVSELAYLHDRLDDVEAPEKAYYPGRRFPAHVFQRAGILSAQLIELERLVRENPDWLEGPALRQGGQPVGLSGTSGNPHD